MQDLELEKIQVRQTFYLKSYFEQLLVVDLRANKGKLKEWALPYKPKQQPNSPTLHFSDWKSMPEVIRITVWLFQVLHCNIQLTFN